MNELTRIFEGNSVRIVEENSEFWFVAKDICDVLELGTEQIRRLDDDEKGLRKVQTPGGCQDMAIINESGLYSLIMRSNKPNAKRFKKWVTSEVLPSIRKKGSYGIQEDMFNLPKTYTEALEDLLKTAREKEKLECKVVEMLPDFGYAQRVKDSTSLMTITVIAKSMGLGPVTLNRFLKEKGVLRHDNGLFTYRYQDRTDYGKVVTYNQVVDGKQKTREHLKWTQKGRQFITELWDKHHNKELQSA